MTIQELFEAKQAEWADANIKFLGVSPIDDTKPYEEIQRQLDEDCAKYWNGPEENLCSLVKNLNSGKLNAEIAKQTPNSYKLAWNMISLCIDFLADYGGQMKIIGAMPTPCVDLSWIINKSHYVPRVTATKDMYHLIQKTDFNVVKGEGWEYNSITDEFFCNVIDKRTGKAKFVPTVHEIMTNYLSIRSKCLLEAVYGEPLTEENFKKALVKVPQLDHASIFNYRFQRMEYFEEAVLNSKKCAKPTKRTYLGVNTIIGAKKKIFINEGQEYDGCLVRSKSKIFALENYNSCINNYGNQPEEQNHSYSRQKGKSKSEQSSNFKPPFTYCDTNGFFDSFKTVTTKSAGRQRLLLDNVTCKDGMLWITEPDGSVHNMYEYLDRPQRLRLSCLSEAPFCNNDKPKRIMMNAKMTAQSVTLADEIDDLTHRIQARVGFTDIEGYTAADSIIISESFAKKLRTYDKDILCIDTKSNLYKGTIEPIYNGTLPLDIDALSTIYPSTNKAILLNYENVKIDSIELIDIPAHKRKYARVFLSWEIPFGLGDKITNLHGAKGTVGLILPDDQMPCLTKKVGNMEPGPLEVIISGFSTIRRGSLGQIFEAWATASGIKLEHGEDFISKMIEKYQKEMKEYSANSIVKYGKDKMVIPVGYNYIMRLYHHASTKVSCSSADHGYTRTLKFGEMEKFNLVANGCPNILRELGIRSIVKYVGSHKLVTEMESSRELPKNTKINMRFLEVLKSMGYELKWVNTNTIVTNNADAITNADYEFTDEIDDEYYLLDDDMDEIDLANRNSVFCYNKENDEEDGDGENEEYVDENQSSEN